MNRSRIAPGLARGVLVLLAVAAAGPGAHAQDRERRGGAGGQTAPAAAPVAAAPAAPSGPTGSSYLQSCRNSTTSGGRLFSECRTETGQYRRSSIEVGKCVGDVGNHNGILGCNGAIPQDGGLVVEDFGRGGNTRAGDGGRNDTGAGRGGYDGGRGSNSGGDGRDGYSNGNGYTRGSSNGDGYNGGRGGYPGGNGYNGYNGSSGYDGGGRSDDRSGYIGGGYNAGGGRYNNGGYANGGGYGRSRADVVLFEGPNYTGRSFEVTRDIDDLKDVGFNDRARSVRIYSGRWKLCREANFSRCEHLSRDVPDLNALNAGAQISSIERE